MIVSILSFSLKSMICSLLFMGYYILALKKISIHKFNRIYLLGSALLSLILPFVKIELLPAGRLAGHDFPLLPINANKLEQVLQNGASHDSFNWPAVFIFIYFGVSLFIVARLMARSISIYRLKNKGELEYREGFLFIKTNDPRAPFSFMRMLFWPLKMDENSPEGRDVLAHELAHIRQHHTFDKIFMELMLAACWLNPFNWLIKKEVWLQHEFLADKHAIKNRDSEAFAKMLLYGITHSADRSIINSLTQSPIKRRLFMITQPEKNNRGLLRSLLCIPVIVAALLLLSAKKQDPTLALRSPDRIVLVLDAAHGGDDAGSQSIYGYLEKDVSLGICQKLVSLSGEYNIEIVTTRDKDMNTTLEERMRLCNNTEADLFMSVHIGKKTEGDTNVNTYKLGIKSIGEHYDKSILLASSIANQLKVQKLPAEVVDYSRVFVLRENKHPALVLECGNIDDARNMALFNDGASQEKFCRNILRGIVEYQMRLNKK